MVGRSNRLGGTSFHRTLRLTHAHRTSPLAHRGLLAACLCLLGVAPLGAQAFTLDTGTVIPIRFVEGLRSGRDAVGTAVVLQTMASVMQDQCMVLAPFRTVWATVSTSKGGRILGRGGALGLTADSLRRRSGDVVALEAVLDSLEWPGARILPSGIVEQKHRKLAAAAALPAVAATGGLAIVPVALIGSWSFLRDGAGVEIVAGELGSLRVVAPLELARAASCQPLTDEALAIHLPTLPGIAPRATDRSGLILGDQFNVILQGTEAQVREAFRAAGWAPEGSRSLANLMKGSAAVVFDKRDRSVAFSPEYYEGRAQDLGFQRVGLSARERHHVRLWQLDAHPGTWVGAANEDVGLKVALDRLSATHRMDPDIDRERDILAGDLEAGGCARFLGLVALPGAVTSGRNTSAQEFSTDGRSAILKTGCRTHHLQPR